MKKTTILIAALFALAAPLASFAAAEEMQHSHGAMDEQCTKECAMLIKNCTQEVNSIQTNIKKLQVAIKEKGASTYTLDELKILNKKLQEANATLRDLQKPGK